MRIVASALAPLVLVAGAANAKNETPAAGPVPDWVSPSNLLPVPPDAGGLVFVRRNDTLMHLDENGQTQYQGYRIRILHPNALQLGNLAVAWNPHNGPATVHMVQIHRQNETIDVLKSTSFEVLRRENQLEAASLDGMLTAVLRVPDLRVDDELEFAVTIRSKDPTLGDNNAGLLFLAPSPPPGRFRLGLSWAKGQEPKIKMSPDMAAAAQRKDAALTASFDNPSPLVAPKDAPPRYKWQRIVEYTRFKDWPSVSAHFAPLFAKASKLDPNSPIRAEAKRIASAHANPLDRASAALKLTQQQVRYIYVGLDGGNLTPASADETWKRRYGDCKGKTALLLSLLSELGIDAEPVMVSNSGLDDGLDERLPNPGLFDHVLVRARINGASYWLDGTLPPVAKASPDPVVQYRWVLPLASNGRSIERLNWQTPLIPDEVTLYEIDARAGFEEPAKISSTMIVRGMKGLEQQAQLSALTPDQLLSGMRQEMVGNLWQTIEATRWRYDEKAHASVLTIIGTGTLDWDNDGGGKKSLTLPGGGFNPPERRVRPAEQDQSAPFYNESDYSCHVTTVRLPESTKASEWSFNKGFDTRIFGRNYYRTFGMRDGTIRMIRGSRVEQREIDAALAKRDNSRIAAFDNSMAQISYDPAGGSAKGPGDPAVPATYEIDWTANDVPCLSSTKER